MRCSQIQSLEELSDRTNVGRRCFERVLMCKPYSIWFLSPGREWHDGLTYGTLGQEVCPLPTSFHDHLSVFCGVVSDYFEWTAFDTLCGIRSLTSDILLHGRRACIETISSQALCVNLNSGARETVRAMCKKNMHLAQTI